jgi:type I restriction enzyme, S subunit
VPLILKIYEAKFDAVSKRCDAVAPIMSFPCYPQYKDSGVEWLGEVPGHWETAPLKTVTTHNDDVLDETTAADFEISYVDISSVDGLSGIKDKETMLFSNAPSRARRRVKHGDVIVSTVRTYLKAIARIRDPEENLVVSTGFAVIRPCGGLVPDFLGCLVSAGYFVDQVIARSTGVSYPAINASDLVGIPVPVPPLAEQTQIAAFLDRETAKIDELVAQQRRLMELLKEKRQAVISHAVTQGLNPQAPMKPSGIEWLGDVPAHWELTRLKYLGEAITGLTYSPMNIVEDDTSGTLVLRSSNVQRGVITFDDNVYVSAVIPDELVTQIGDILICSRNGSRALIGKNATINERSVGLTFGAFMTVFRSKHSAYIACVLNSPLFEFQSGAFMTSTINQLTIGVLNNFEVPLPPEKERAEIAEFLAIESAKFNSLTTEAQRAIDLLQERRTALISAAVTGQIDIRQAA